MFDRSLRKTVQRVRNSGRKDRVLKIRVEFEMEEVETLTGKEFRGPRKITCHYKSLVLDL